MNRDTFFLLYFEDMQCDVLWLGIASRTKAEAKYRDNGHSVWQSVAGCITTPPRFFVVRQPRFAGEIYRCSLLPVIQGGLV